MIHIVVDSEEAQSNGYSSWRKVLGGDLAVAVGCIVGTRNWKGSQTNGDRLVTLRSKYFHKK